VPSADHGPSEFFGLFVDNEILECMVRATNEHANRIINAGEILKEQSRFRQWVETDVNETKLFVGILMWMGLVEMPSLTSYWKTNRLYWNSISSLMSRNRFQLLLRARHFTDRDNNCENRLHKID
jgi:Transposase IS4